MDNVIRIFQKSPELGIFLALAIGYFIGKIKVHNFGLGSVAGTLLAGLVIGLLNLQIDPLVKTVSFDLFLFALGYSVGPQFFVALKKDGLPQIVIALIVAGVGLVATLLCAKGLGLDAGTAAGLAAGGLTQFPTAGTATAALDGLAIADGLKQQLLRQIPIATAITYPFGTIGIMIFLVNLAPRLLGINFRDECRKYDATLMKDKAMLEQGLMSAYQPVAVRAYRVTNQQAIGKTVADLEEQFAEDLLFIERLQRNGYCLDVTPDLVIQADDVIAVAAQATAFTRSFPLIGQEVNNIAILNFPIELLDVVVTNPQLFGKTLADLTKQHGHGLYLLSLSRQGRHLPRTANTRLNRGDILQVSGAQRDVERFVRVVGYPERPSNRTDIIYLSVGTFIGILLGLITITIAGVPVTLSTAGGCLLTGLVFGWLHAIYPVMGNLPIAAQAVLTDLGLAIFIAVFGIEAGPAAVQAFQTQGALFFLKVFLAGVVVTLLPAVVCIYASKYILKLNPVILLGAIAGGQTTSACLNALIEEGESNSPTLGYTVAYAVGNILLTVLGPIIIMLVGLPPA